MNRGWSFLLIACLMLLGREAFAGWQTFSRGEGLVDGSVTALLEDHAGNIWIGASRGPITRYDGVSWSTFPLQGQFAGGAVFDLCQQADGTILAATEGGFFRFDGQGFTRVVDSSFDVFSVLEDKSGFVWFATHDGIYRWDGATFRYYGAFDGLTDDYVNQIALAPDGAIFAATRIGLYRFDGVRWNPYGGGGPVPGTELAAVLVERSGAVWVLAAGSSVPQRFDGASWSAQPGVTGAPRWQDRKGRIWFSGSGVTVLDGNRVTRYTVADGVADASTTRILEDQHGNIWVGTPSGLNRFDGQFWTRANAFNAYPSVPIRAMARERSGTIWFSADSTGAGPGVYRMDSLGTVARFTAADGLGSGLIYDMLQDAQGSMWFATASGLTRYSNGIWQDGASLGSNYPSSGWPARHLAETPDGTIWFSVSDGAVYRFTPSQSQYAPAYAGAYTDPPFLFVDRFGTLWIASLYGDLLQLPALGEPILWSNANVTSYIEGMAEDRLGRIWIEGRFKMQRLENNVLRDVTTSDGLLTDLMRPVLTDRDGNLWLSSDAGVARFDGASWRYFTSPQDLGSLSVGPILQASDGSIWMGGRAGAVHHQFDRVAPRTVIVPPGPPALSPVRNQVISFAAGFREVNGIEFEYSIDGGPWSGWSSSTVWFGSGLQDGPHTFRVHARDEDLNTDSPGATVSFEIDATPPAPLLASPRFGDPVQGIVAVVGRASDARFQSYRVEVQPVDGGVATTLATGTNPVTDDTLATFDSHAYPDGDYRLRLTVVDSLGLSGTVEVTVVVDNDFPFASETAPISLSAALGGDVFTTNREAHLYFAPHSFARDALIQIGALPDSAVPATVAGSATRVAPGFQVAWGSKLQKPVSLDLSVTPPGSSGTRTAADASLAIFHSPDGTTWARVGGTLRDGRLEAVIEKPGRYAVFSESPSASGTGSISQLSLSPRVFSLGSPSGSGRIGIGFTLSKPSPVTVRVYSRSGRLIREVAHDLTLQSGANLIHWDGHDRNGGQVPDGMYLVTVEAVGTTRTQTLAVVR